MSTTEAGPGISMQRASATEDGDRLAGSETSLTKYRYHKGGSHPLSEVSYGVTVSRRPSPAC